MKITKKYLIGFMFFAILGFSQFFLLSEANAANLWDKQVGKTQIAQSFGQSTKPTDIRVIVGNIINVVLSLMGIIFVSLMVYSGYNWMTSVGDQTKIKKAQETIQKAIIGLVIILMAYGITQFVINALFKATETTG